MRIAFLTYEYPGTRPGGIGGYVFKIAGALAQAGHDIHIYTLALPSAAPRPNGVHIHDVADLADRIQNGALPGPLGAAVLGGGVAIYKLAVGWLLCDELRRDHATTPFDIVEAAEYEALGLPLMIRPIPGLPVITHLHLGSAVNRWGNGDAATPDDLVIDSLEAAAIVGADAIYAATQAVARDTRQQVPAFGNIPIIPHCVPVGITQLGPAPRKGHVLYVGRLQRRKGVEDIALAAATFLKRHQDAEIHIVGEDVPRADEHRSMMTFMRAQIPTEPRDRMIFKGELSPAAVQAELAGCRFALAPSRVDNFAGTVVDTLLAGRALIYAGQTGNEEVAGDAGIRVDPQSPPQLAEAMHRLWTDDALLDDLSARGPRRMRDFFTSARTIDARIAFYQQVRAHHQSQKQTITERFARLPATHIGPAIEALSLLTGACSGAESAQTNTPGRILLNIFRMLAQQSSSPSDLWLFGAGRFTNRLLAERYVWETHGFTIAGIVDDNPRFADGSGLQGIRVLSRTAALSAIDQHQLSIPAMVLATDTLENKFCELTQQFRDCGTRIIRMSEHF